MSSAPKTAYAVQLTGPDALRINTSKAVPQPGPHQVLCQVEAVGLCFSDLKLLKQFTGHPRKKTILSGIEPKTLDEISSYVPGDLPTVPGHEAVVRIIAVGPGTTHKVGQRALVQTDYRWLPTDGSNASFGYNFEGGLQEYVLMDERVVISPDGESLLIPVSEELGASAVALIEPWACVENAYVSPERKTLAPAGRLLVVVDAGHKAQGIAECIAPGKPPAQVNVVGAEAAALGNCGTGASPVKNASLTELEGKTFDDIIYFGASRETIERLDTLLAPRGLFNIVLGGKKIGTPATIGIGRVHYGGMRFIGTTGGSARESLDTIPVTPDIRENDKVLILGAAGPMGLMHVVRTLCLGVKGLDIVGTDFDDERLAQLDSKALPLAKKNGLKYESINPSKNKRKIDASYTALMVPVAALVADAVTNSLPNGIINIFAGIPAGVCHAIDLDAYIAKKLYFIGTSGSVIRDMKIVLGRMEAGQLDTNISVAAVSGMQGALDGIAAVENRTIPGKIIVYPELHDMPLTRLEDLKKSHPAVHAKLANGQWSREAERELLGLSK